MSGYQSLLSLPLAERPAAQPVAITPAGTVTWSQWQRELAALHRRLVAAPGRHWALYHDDSYQFALGFIALAAAGKNLVIPGNRQRDFVAQLAPRLDGWLGQGAPAGVDSLPLIAELSAAPDAATALPTQHLAAEAVTVEVFTSGSTGDPKGLTKVLGQLAAEVDTLQSTWGAALAGSRVVGTVSHQHIYGLLFRVLWPLAAGVPFVSTSAVYPENLVDQVGPGPAWLVASPAHYKRLPGFAGLEQLRGRLRGGFSSGGPLSRDASLAMTAVIDAPIWEVFGSSETGGIGYRRQRADEADTPWTPFPGVALSLTETRALQVRSPHLPHREPFTMADAAELLEDNRFRLRGRLDRVVKIEEKRVSLDELERWLVALPELSEARALVLPGERTVLGVVAVLTAAGREQLAAGKRGLVQALRGALSRHMEAVALPRKWRFVDALPMNAQGKIRQQDLLALFTHAPVASASVASASGGADADGRGTAATAASDGPVAHTDLRQLPTVRERAADGDEVRYELQLAADEPAFAGHFPQAAILPGVVQLDWAIQLGQREFALDGGVQRVEVLKFQQVLQPRQPVILHLRFDGAKRKLHFRFVSDRGHHASGRVVWA